MCPLLHIPLDIGFNAGMPGLLKEKIAGIEVSLERKDFGSAPNSSLEIDDLELEVESIYGNPVSSYFKESRLY